jgi:hypothetical protein
MCPRQTVGSLGGREGRVPGSCEAQRPCIGNRAGQKRRESMRVHLHEDGQEGRFHGRMLACGIQSGKGRGPKMELDERSIVDEGAWKIGVLGFLH